MLLHVSPVGLAQHQSGVDRVEIPLHFSAGCLWSTHNHNSFTHYWHICIYTVYLYR